MKYGNCTNIRCYIKKSDYELGHIQILPTQGYSFLARTTGRNYVDQKLEGYSISEQSLLKGQECI